MGLFDQVPQYVGYIVALATGLTPTFVALANRDGKRLDNKLALQQLKAGQDDKFLASLDERLKRAEERAETLNKELNAQAVQLAEVQGELKYLRMSETALKTENLQLREENKGLRSKNERLNDENEAQAEAIAQLQGRLTVLDPAYKGPDIML